MKITRYIVENIRKDYERLFHETERYEQCPLGNQNPLACLKQYKIIFLTFGNINTYHWAKHIFFEKGL